MGRAKELNGINKSKANFQMKILARFARFFLKIHSKCKQQYFVFKM